MSWRPFSLLPQASVAAVQEAVRETTARWCSDWGVAAGEVSVVCERAWETSARGAHWQAGHGTGEQVLWLACGDEFAAQLQRLMYPVDNSRSAGTLPVLAGGAAAAAMDALLASLRDLLPAGDRTAARPSVEFGNASGAVLAVVHCGRASVQALFNSGAVQAIAGLARMRNGAGSASGAAATVDQPLPPVPYQTVLAQVPVRLEVALGSTEVALGSLRALALGDVIRLQGQADQALVVHGPNGRPLLAGYLGVSEGQLALELVPNQIEIGVQQ